MGKTKDVIVNNDNTVTLIFKDDATGEDGVFNPGANQVALKINGMGRAGLILSQHFFRLAQKAEIRCHFIDWNLNEGYMLAEKLSMLPIEFVWRSKTWGSFCKTYGVDKGIPLANGIIDPTLKNDDLGDPRIQKEAVIALGWMTEEQFEACDRYVRCLAHKVLVPELTKNGYELIDFKVEFGLDDQGKVVLADEISGGIWRVFKDGETADPIECAKMICPEYH